MNIEKLKLYLLKRNVIIPVVIFFLLAIFFVIPNLNVKQNRRVFYVNVLLKLIPQHQHSFGGQTEYKVEYQNNGINEFVLNKDGIIIKNDLLNKSKINYFSPITAPLEHFDREILPWLKWGEDKQTITKEERIDAYLEDFFDSADLFRKNYFSRNKNIEKYLLDNDKVVDFFDKIFESPELKGYNFSRTDRWIFNDKKFEILKEKIKIVFKRQF
ncbi:MAG: hypothetical protein Ta2D_00100 [Rickettsiales bacterium]|nr:MAG: hypothetical protein Ta2D_00100 [Rickettsiales bacterium]